MPKKLQNGFNQYLHHNKPFLVKSQVIEGVWGQIQDKERNLISSCSRWGIKCRWWMQSREKCRPLYIWSRLTHTKNVWNADWIGLFYLRPLLDYAAFICERFQEEEDSSYFLARCNSDGSEKIPLMSIGTGLDLRACKIRLVSIWALTITRNERRGWQWCFWNSMLLK